MESYNIYFEPWGFGRAVGRDGLKDCRLCIYKWISGGIPLVLNCNRQSQRDPVRPNVVNVKVIKGLLSQVGYLLIQEWTPDLQSTWAGCTWEM